MTDARTATATFKPEKRTLSVTVTGTGTVTGTDDFACSSGTCTQDYDYGTSVTLTATEATGHDFEKWSGNCTGTTTTCTLEMTDARTATATFKPEKRTLSVTVTGTGTVTGTDDFTCSSGTCTQDYDYGANVTLTATEATGHDFEKWGGACTGTTTTCALEMTDARTATATFKPEKRTLSVTVTGTGTVTGTDDFTCSSGTCTQDYDYGTSVTLTATAATNHDFEKWGGSCSGTSETCTLEMTEARTATATFKPEKRTLSVTVASKGTVAGTGDFTCSSGTCTKDYDHGTSVTLTATEATGHDFEKWGGACSGTTTTCTLEMTENRAATATFKPEQRSLTVTRPSDGWVRATGISCGAGRRPDCGQTYDYGTTVTLRVTADSGFSFGRWSGDCSGTSTTCDLAMTENRSVGVTFNVQTRRLSVTIDGEGEVWATGDRTCTSGTCNWDYNYDTRVTLSATADDGYEFDEWSGASCSGSSTACPVTMTHARSATAKFKRAKQRLEVEAGTGGKVTGPGIDCGSNCTEDYEYDTKVTLTAVPNAHYALSSWSGCDSKSGKTCKVTMDGAQEVAATFSPKPKLTLTATPTKGGSVTRKPGGDDCGTDCWSYGEGDEVTLTAVPARGYVVSWSGCEATKNTCKVTMNGAQAVTATFSPKLTVTRTPTTGGTVSSSPEGDDCGTNCWSYGEGSGVTLTADPTEGYVVSWRGCDEVTEENECEVKMDGAQAVTATFSPKLTLTVTPTAGGTVSRSPEGTSCNTNCWSYDHRKKVTLTARPNDGYAVSWSGCDKVTGNECEVTMNGAKAVVATFVKRLSLTVTTTGSGSVSRDPSGDACPDDKDDCWEYDEGKKVKLTADPNNGYTFSWGGACEKEKGETCTVTMGKPETVSATFTPNTLTVKRPSYGYVTEGTNIDCGSGSARTKCKKNYNHGETVTLTATGDPNFRRESWSGCKSDTSTSCQVEMKGETEISATFEPDCPSGCVLTECGGQDVCKCNGSTCPSGFAQQKNCSTTQAKQCIGDNRDCATLIRGRSCTTRQHAFSNTAQEYCFYETRDGSWLQCKHKTKVCFATIAEIGCLPSAVAIEGTDPGPGGASDGEWSELALGYILSDFECGETPNSCTVTIGDEVETTTTHGVEDKEDSLENWLWECHSDNGTVRECSLPKDSD